jgi:hypothetical protein
MITPLGQLILDLFEIKQRFQYQEPEVSRLIKRALERFDPDLKDARMVKALKENGSPN